MQSRKSFYPILVIALIAATRSLAAPECPSLAQIRQYIKQSWTTLRRSNATLLKSATDTKVNQSGRVTLYVPPGEDPQKIENKLHHEITPAAAQRVTVVRLPENPLSVKEAGLLYLPYPYVVPGGRFNEMYGWDSYFIQLGLLRDGNSRLRRTWQPISFMESETTAPF